jgi:quercetin dioxygenase-like cupin family protein
MRKLMLLLPLTLLAQRPVPVNNEWARVVIATANPGPKGRMHKHEMNRVMVYIDKGTQVLGFEDGSSKTIAARAGEVQWDPKGGMHTSMIPSGPPFRIVEIELKKEGGAVQWPKVDPLTVAPKNYAAEFENSQVRVLRVKLAPHEKISEHEHGTSRIIVPLTEVDIAVSGADGAKTSLKAKPGEAIFAQPGRHSEENMLDKPVELILVDLKG